MQEREDNVDRMLAQWGKERPDIDTSGMAVVLRVLRVASHLSERLKAVMAPSGLAPFEYDVLSALRRAGQQGGLTPTELCEAAQLTSGAMTHRINRLETRGLVRRVASGSDRRSVTVTLTPNGQTLVDGIVGARMSDAIDSLSALNKKDRADLARLLRKINANLP
ncbi:HTH-type transcriptional regulator MhqR [Planctomycetes bacterium Poly30]|uniref:HTH-type transcriptional regulator MhqR n=1 Tax=Saltatorellus ferox TaxID=2528018 RepID=A0A518EQS0_9BACT|nr:HTH-type transcriptional regulator MhqR [Planctomycetes bacterium Poly30]